MEHSKAFIENDIIGICNQVIDHCNILNQQHLSTTQAYTLYAFLPLLLDRILGSPTKKGLIQCELSAEQMTALLQLLSVHGVFLKSLFLLSQFSHYSYELITSNLSKDIGEVLSSGAIQLLPRLYNNSCKTVRSKTDDAFVLRTAATSHSTLLPQNGKDNRMIRFNMIQFYLFHFVSVPTFSSPTPASFTVTRTPSSTYNTHLSVHTPIHQNGYTTTTTTTNTNSNIYPNQQRQAYPSNQNKNTSMFGQYPNHHKITTTPSSTTTHSSQPHLIKPGTLTRGPYKNLVRDYFNLFIPLTIQPPESTLFFDTCMELWIRTVSIPPNGRLHPDLLYYITYFIQFIVASDLRKAVEENTWTYQLIHQEIYLLISRLLHNWSKDNNSSDDNLLSVIDLWTIWASPWKFGESPKSVIKQDTLHSFASIVLDNIPVYFQLVEMILEKASTFTFTNMRQQRSSSSAMSIENIDDHIRILHRLTNVLYTENLTRLLGWIEMGLYSIDSGNIVDMTPFEDMSRLTGLSMQVVFQKLKYCHGIMIALDGTGLIKKRNLYIHPGGDRLSYLTMTVMQVQQAIHKMESNNIFGVAVMQRKQQLMELKKVEEKLRFVFDLSRTPIQEMTSQVMKETVVPRPASPLQAGLSKGGFLTPEELELVKQGYLQCSKKNIPKVGRRPRTVVRSYEWAEVLMWTVNMEDKINPWYIKNVPQVLKKKLQLPDEICIRFLAAPINWPYLLASFIAFYYVLRFFFGLIF